MAPAHRSSSRDWAWRRRLRGRRNSYRAYRVVVGTLGLIVVVTGLILVPFPGPGWLIVFLGVGIWATEFHWAHRLNLTGRRWLGRWTAWIMARSIAVRFLVGTASAAFVGLVVWVTMRIVGLPAWTPGWAADPLRQYLGL